MTRVQSSGFLVLHSRKDKKHGTEVRHGIHGARIIMCLNIVEQNLRVRRIRITYADVFDFLQFLFYFQFFLQRAHKALSVFIELILLEMID